MSSISASALNISISGFNAAATSIQTAANNLANAQSTQTQNADGSVSKSPYQPQAVQQTSLANGGVQAKVVPAPGQPQDVFQPSSPDANQQGIVQQPNVDEGQQVVQMQMATYNAQGNLNAIKAEQKTQQALLNIIS